MKATESSCLLAVKISVDDFDFLKQRAVELEQLARIQSDTPIETLHPEALINHLIQKWREEARF